MSLARYLSKLGALLNSSGQVPAAGLAPDAVTNGAIAANSIALSKLARVGTAGHILTSNGTGSDPSYQAPPAGGVTSVATGNGLSGGTITTTGTLTIAAPTSFSVGSYIEGYNSSYPTIGSTSTSVYTYDSNSGANTTRAGTWRCLGGGGGTNPGNGYPCNLWVRTA